MLPVLSFAARTHGAENGTPCAGPTQAAQGIRLGQPGLSLGAAVNDLALSPDRRWLAAVGENRRYAVFDLERKAVVIAGRLPVELTQDRLFSAAVSRSAQMLAIGGSGDLLAVLNTESGAVVWERHDTSIDQRAALAMSEAGSPVVAHASKSRDEIVLTTARSGKAIATIPLENRRLGVDSLALSANGAVLAVGVGGAMEPRKGVVTVWDVPTRKRKAIVRDTGSVVAVSADGATLAVLDGRGPLAVGVFRGPSYRKVATLSAGTKASGARIEFSPRATRLAVAAEDGVHVFDVGGRKHLRRIEAGLAHDVAWVSDDRVAVAGRDSVVRIWNAERGVVEETAGCGHVGAVTSVAWDASGQALHSVGRDRTLRRWSAPAWTERTLADLAPDGAIRVSAFSDGERLLVGYQTGRLEVRALDGKGAQTLATLGAPVLSVSVSPSRFVAAVSAAQGTVVAPDGKAIGVALPEGAIEMTSVTLDREARRLAVGLASRTSKPLALVDARTGTLERLVELPGSAAVDVALLGDGSVAAVTMRDSHVTLVDTATGQIRRRLSSPGRGLTRLRAFARRQLIAAGDRSGSMYLWDVDRGETRCLTGLHDGPIHDLSVSPDESRLAVASADGTMTVVEVRNVPACTGR